MLRKNGAQGVHDMNLFNLLTNREQQSLMDYVRRYERDHGGRHPSSDPNAVFYIGDDPIEGNYITWSCLRNSIPTLKTNSGTFWVPFLDRWITTRELLAASGFPTYEVLAQAMGVPVFTVEDVHTTRKQLGNGMHAGNLDT